MKCKNCGAELPAGVTSRRAFCSDICRVKFNRSQKAQDFFFDAMVLIRKMKREGKIDELKRLSETINDMLD
jgi:hypothetical protein